VSGCFGGEDNTAISEVTTGMISQEPALTRRLVVGARLDEKHVNDALEQ
jgi:hypothetical protein